MITGLYGIVKMYNEGAVIVDVNHVLYEVFVPDINKETCTKLEQLQAKELFFTYHYIQVLQSTATPMLFGFLNAKDREFFFKILEVKGIGPKTAIKMMSKPIEELASLIDNGQKDQLKKLPGISLQRASDMINKLGGRLGAYHGKEGHLKLKEGLLDFESDVQKTLLGLGYKKLEIMDMIHKAYTRNQSIFTAEDLLAEIYKKTES